MNPVIVTFGAGACAMAGGARTPRTATRATASTNSLLITASSKKRVSCSNVCCAAKGRQPQQKQTADDVGLIRDIRRKRQVKTTFSDMGLTSLPQGAYSLHARPAERQLASA